MMTAIAERIDRRLSQLPPSRAAQLEHLLVGLLDFAEAEDALERGSMPNWTGWKATDALQLLERYGYSVQTKGNGRVRSWVPGGGRKSITLILG
jgi:hypothetical protein